MKEIDKRAQVGCIESDRNVRPGHTNFPSRLSDGVARQLHSSIFFPLKVGMLRRIRQKGNDATSARK